MDRAVLCALDRGGEDDEFSLTETVDEVEEAVEEIVQMRDEGAGKKTSVLVRRSGRGKEDAEEIDLPGVESSRESATLGDPVAKVVGRSLSDPVESVENRAGVSHPIVQARAFV